MHIQKREGMKKALQQVTAVELKQYREKNRLTQEAMAARLRMSVRTYIDLEHGACLPSATTLALHLAFLSKAEQARFLAAVKAAVEQVSV